MKLQLTDEQIAMLIQNETDRLNQQFQAEKAKLEKKLESDIKDLNRKLESEIAKLAGKYKYIVIDEAVTTKKRAVISNEILKQMVTEGKTVKEMAAFFNTSENSIRNKLFRLNLKLNS